MPDLSLTQSDADKILNAIQANHIYAPNDFVPFQTEKALGYIPKTHLETYLDTGLFEYDELKDILAFAGNVQGFNAKSEAIHTATAALIGKGLIRESTEPYKQERAVGDDTRLENPEFKIDRAYYRHYGFMADGVFMNVVIQKNSIPHVLLQVRSGRVENANTYDFAIGGAVKFPQNLADALKVQSLEEMGIALEALPEKISETTFRFSETEKGWVTQNCHHLYAAYVDGVKTGEFDREEVQGFAILSIPESIKACADGRFNRQNTQSFISALVTQNLMPEFPGSDKIRELVSQHMPPVSGRQIAPQKTPRFDI